MTGRAWSELAEHTHFDVEIGDGFPPVVCVEPSVLKLTALGVLPPSLVLGTQRGGAPAGAAGNTVEKLLLDEKAQDALLKSSIISPVIGGEVELADLGKYRDTIILAILNRLSGVEAVASAQFPGEASAGEPDRSDGTGDGDASVAGAGAIG